jgi:hypothetical protein
VFLHGQRDTGLSRAPKDGVLVDLPELPHGHGAAQTAEYLHDVIRGAKPLPASIAAQSDCLVETLNTLAVR